MQGKPQLHSKFEKKIEEEDNFGIVYTTKSYKHTAET